MVIKVAQRLIINITPSVLGITSGSSEIAIFSAALTIENYVWNFSTVIGTMLLPKVSGIVFGDNSKPGALLELMIKVGRIQFLTLAAIVSIFLVAGKGFFLNWLGVEFEKSYIVSVLLILPGLIIIPQETASTALVALNKVRFNAYSRLTIAFISISLTFVLSAYYGAIGSAIAIFIGNLIGGAIVLNIVYWKVLKIDIWEFFKKCQLRLVLPFILVLFIGFFLNNIVEEVSWFNTIAKISLCFMVYALSAYIFVLNKYEKSLFHGLLNRRYN